MIYKNGYSKFNFPMNPYVRLLLVGRSVGCLDRSVIIEKAGRLYFIVSIGTLVRSKIQNLGHKFSKIVSLSNARASPELTSPLTHSCLPSSAHSRGTIGGGVLGVRAPLLHFIFFLRTCI